MEEEDEEREELGEDLWCGRHWRFKVWSYAQPLRERRNNGMEWKTRANAELDRGVRRS